MIAAIPMGPMLRALGLELVLDFAGPVEPAGQGVGEHPGHAGEGGVLVQPAGADHREHPSASARVMIPRFIRWAMSWPATIVLRSAISRAVSWSMTIFLTVLAMRSLP